MERGLLPVPMKLGDIILSGFEPSLNEKPASHPFLKEPHL
jgi:hypothetical protein